jgi:MDMPI C-terminal domain
VRPRPDRVEAGDGSSGQVHAVVEAGPQAMLSWLWGRAGDEAVTVSGDPAWAAYLRRLLAATTQ